uniref:Uncharacterized protein n=1 Tax=Bos indicus x Bos taurus TaxID=30522 RepID=A0A4W2GNU6_BOBOX
MRSLRRRLLLLLLVLPATLLLRGGPGGSLAVAQDLTEDEETVEDSIIEDEDDEAEVEEDEPTDLAEDKEEDDVSGEPEASPSADTTILFVKGEDFPPMGGRPFGLVINLNYKDLNGNVFQDAVFNQTVTIIEREDGLDGETIFMYMFPAGLGQLVVVGLHQLLESRKRKRPIQKIEMGTSSQNDINKASPRRLPRKRAHKRSVGSEE